MWVLDSRAFPVSPDTAMRTGGRAFFERMHSVPEPVPSREVLWDVARGALVQMGLPPGAVWAGAVRGGRRWGSGGFAEEGGVLPG